MGLASVVAFGPLSERLIGIRDRFAEGGRWTEVAAVFLLLLSCTLVLSLISRRQHRSERPEPERPTRLFRQLLRQLGLTPREQRLLRRMAADLRLAQPTMILLSPKLFSEQAAAWSKSHTNTPTDEIDAIARRLFSSA
jgi:hypothetical protein